MAQRSRIIDSLVVDVEDWSIDPWFWNALPRLDDQIATKLIGTGPQFIAVFWR